ncbi:MAG: hypothetical protein C3F13_02245 [Anaerolineales bacterium]|nr:MAG: hypothetical protein C3F13_02245 [Anaerolineales bacterium]
MSELKTKPSEASVEEYLNTIEDVTKRNDSFVILEMMRQITEAEPRMWGSSIIGFGDRHYRYESGREGDWFLVGFSPRKENLTLYLTFGGLQDIKLLDKLGKYKTGKGCLYLKRLREVNIDVLKELIILNVEKNSG